MELRIKKDELLKGSGRAQAISEKRSSMQILSNLLLNASEDGLEILATDLEIGFRGTYPAETLSPGQACLPARHFHSIIRELPADEVYLKVEENQRVLITGGRSRYSLAGLPPEEYPDLPQHDEVNLIGVPVDDMREMLDKTISFMASEEGRYNLAGVYLERPEESQRLRMVATDGHRLAIIERELEKVPNLDISRGAIIPRKGVLEMRRLLDESEEASLGVKGSAAVLESAQAMLIMRLLESRYPDYRQIVPDDAGLKIFTVNRPAILDALRRIAILVTDKYRGVRLTVSSEGLELSHQNPDLGEAKENVEAAYEGEELTIAFNVNYLLDALKVMSSEEITFGLSDPNKPVKVTGPADENFLAVIMPMQV